MFVGTTMAFVLPITTLATIVTSTHINWARLGVVALLSMVACCTFVAVYRKARAATVSRGLDAALPYYIGLAITVVLPTSMLAATTSQMGSHSNEIADPPMEESGEAREARWPLFDGVAVLSTALCVACVAVATCRIRGCAMSSSGLGDIRETCKM